MADKDTSAPRGGGERIPPSESQGRRQAPGQGGYPSRQQPARSGSGYGERRPSSSQSGYGGRSQQPARSGGEYGERRPSSSQSGYGGRPQQPARGGGDYGERRPSSQGGGYPPRQQPARSSGYGERRSSPRRSDVIRCENCGEDYSVTYKRCPFCDERPGRGGGSGRRVANTRGGGYGRPVNPIQVAGLAISVLLILSAVFIVVRFIGAPIFGGGKPGSGSSVSTSQSQSNGSQSAPEPQKVQSVTISETSVDLDSGATHQLTASLLPTGTVGDLVWSSSDPTIAAVDATGLVTNLNAGSADASVTITASCGEVRAEAVVNCKAAGGTITPGTPGGSVSSGSQGVIVNADTGLNIRSGPGREYKVVASASNGSTVTILGEENGWYQIRYNGSSTGYVSKDFVSVR